MRSTATGGSSSLRAGYWFAISTSTSTFKLASGVTVGSGLGTGVGEGSGVGMALGFSSLVNHGIAVTTSAGDGLA